jgi:hypothetical protein
MVSHVQGDKTLPATIETMGRRTPSWCVARRRRSTPEQLFIHTFPSHSSLLT